MIPSSDASLEDKDLSGEDSVSFLFKVEVVSVLEEDFCSTKLIICFAKNLLTNLGGRLSTVDLVGRRTTVD